MAGIPVPFNVRISESDPPNTVSWDSTVLTVTGRRRFTIRDAGDGHSSRLVDAKTFTSPVLPIRLFYPRPIVQSMSRRWLDSLKTRVESDTASD